ncbi:MAG: delta(1)-pyrroline-2-carboxylate reductase family protein [Betaproteobacteria bacterium]|nr:delta(1)-pyrroline-2-carboxylate reductase family protein [Betaproteobacteria bacterium]
MPSIVARLDARALSHSVYHGAVTTRDPLHTARCLPYPALADEVQALLRDPSVRVPAREVLPLAGGGTLFVMPAHDAQVAMCKLITYMPGNAALGLPAIQGQVAVFDAARGTPLAQLDGPTVTARRTAAVTLLAARCLSPLRDQLRAGAALGLVGAGVQACAHLEAFVAGFGPCTVHIASRTDASAQALAAHARTLGCDAHTHASAQPMAATCAGLIVCTPASGVVVDGPLRDDVFVAAVGSFTPQMIELAPALTRWFAQHGRIVIDSVEARHEAGDLLQAGLGTAALPTLAEALQAAVPAAGPLLFKSCGWAGWDLAAARLAARHAMDARSP